VEKGNNVVVNHSCLMMNVALYTGFFTSSQCAAIMQRSKMDLQAPLPIAGVLDRFFFNP
jgi:hypothetical protein